MPQCSLLVVKKEASQSLVLFLPVGVLLLEVGPRCLKPGSVAIVKLLGFGQGIHFGLDQFLYPRR